MLNVFAKSKQILYLQQCMSRQLDRVNIQITAQKRSRGTNRQYFLSFFLAF